MAEYRYDQRGVGADLELGKSGGRLVWNTDHFEVTTDGATLAVLRLGAPVLADDAASRGYVDTLVVAYDIALFIEETPTDAQIVAEFTAVRAFEFAADFIGSDGKILTNPTSTFDIDVQLDTVTIGTISISTGGVFTFTTVGGTLKAVLVGEVITFVAPGTADATAAGASFTLFSTITGTGSGGNDLLTVNDIGAADHTLIITDNNSIVRIGAGSPQTLTIPTNAAVPFGIGSEVIINQGGAGIITVDGPGVTINTPDDLILGIANETARLIKLDTDEWVLVKDIDGAGFGGLDEGGTVAGGPYTSINFIGGNVEATDGGSGQLDVTVTDDAQNFFLEVAASDETTDITTGVAKITFRMPAAVTLNAGNAGVRASLNTVSSSGIPTIDINEGGVSILSTLLTIDVSEKTSLDAAVPVVISDVTLADDAEMTIDIDISGTGAKGLKVALIGVYT